MAVSEISKVVSLLILQEAPAAADYLPITSKDLIQIMTQFSIIKSESNKRF